MSFAGTLGLMLAAVYGLSNLALSALVAVLWRSGLKGMRSTSNQLFALRVFPSAAGIFLTLTVALPAFLIFEPNREAEPVGGIVLICAMAAVLALGNGVLRAVRACAATASRVNGFGPGGRHIEAERKFSIIEVDEPLVAVVGALRPRIVAARCIVAACSEAELRQVIAHEAAHVSAFDNLKLLLMMSSPDVLTWMPAGPQIVEHWRMAAEREADARASGDDPCKRVALASALIKVARLSTGVKRDLALFTLLIRADDVEGRVRHLLTPMPAPRYAFPARTLLACGLVTVGVAAAHYRTVQDVLEALVALGS